MLRNVMVWSCFNLRANRQRHNEEYAHRDIGMLYKQPPCCHRAMNKWEHLSK